MDDPSIHIIFPKNVSDIMHNVLKSNFLFSDNYKKCVNAKLRRMLEDKFPGKVTEHDPFTSVAAGLAIASYHEYQFTV